MLYLNSPTPIIKEEYKEARNKAEVVVRQSRNRLVSNIEILFIHGRQVLTFRILKTLNKNERERVFRIPTKEDT